MLHLTTSTQHPTSVSPTYRIAFTFYIKNGSMVIIIYNIGKIHPERVNLMLNVNVIVYEPACIERLTSRPDSPDRTAL